MTSLPGNCRRARSQATGTPAATVRTVASDATRSESQTGPRSIALEVFAGNEKTVGFEGRSSAWPPDELQERRRERGSARSRQDDGRLVQGRIQRWIDQAEGESLLISQRARDKPGIHRAALDELNSLLHVLAVHQPALNHAPHAGCLQRLLRGKSIRCMRGVCHGDSADGTLRQIFERELG